MTDPCEGAFPVCSEPLSRGAIWQSLRSSRYASTGNSRATEKPNKTPVCLELNRRVPGPQSQGKVWVPHASVSKRAGSELSSTFLLHLLISRFSTSPAPIQASISISSCSKSVQRFAGRALHNNLRTGTPRSRFSTSPCHSACASFSLRLRAADSGTGRSARRLPGRPLESLPYSCVTWTWAW